MKNSDEPTSAPLENSCPNCAVSKQSVPPAKNPLELALAKRRMAFLRLFSTICPLERSSIKMIAQEDSVQIDTALDELFDAQSSVKFYRS